MFMLFILEAFYIGIEGIILFFNVNLLGITPKNLDLVVAFDASASVDRDQFKSIKDIVYNSLSTYDISNPTVRLNLLSFGNKVQEHLKFDNRITDLLLKDKLKAVNRLGGARSISSVLKHIKDTYPKGGSQKKLLLLVITGNTNPADKQYLATEIQNLKRLGFKTAVIAVGQNIKDKELKLLSTGDENDSSGDVLVVGSGNMLPTILGDIEEIIGRYTGTVSGYYIENKCHAVKITHCHVQLLK